MAPGHGRLRRSSPCTSSALATPSRLCTTGSRRARMPRGGMPMTREYRKIKRRRAPTRWRLPAPRPCPHWEFPQPPPHASG